LTGIVTDIIMKASSYFPDIPPRRIKPVMAYLHDKTILQLHHSGIMAKTI